MPTRACYERQHQLRLGSGATVASSSLRRKRTGQDPGPKTGGVVPSDRPASEHGIWSRCRARLGPIRWGDHAVHKFENSERSKKKSRQLKFNTPLFSGFIFIFHFVLFYVIKFLIIAILLLLKLSLLKLLVVA